VWVWVCVRPRFSSEFYVANSLDGTVLVLEELHRAYHHYLKVVPTLYELPGSWGKNVLVTYQMLSEVRQTAYRPSGSVLCGVG
jgi:hypothetical protein